MGSGVLIWLPEIGQAELNHMVRAIYVAKSSKGDMASSANRALDALIARRAEAKKRLGTDDPLALATVMHEMLSDEEYEQSAQKLEGVRLLSLDKHMVRGKGGDVNQFPQLVRYWSSPDGPFGKLPVEHWMDLFKSATASIGHA
jgi:intracellular multiplication protein IcmJ